MAEPDKPAGGGSPFQPQHFRKFDESDDALFYAEPRFVAHIDDAAIAALSAHYAEVLTPQDRILDLMSSWISHLPDGYKPAKAVGLGMNADELARNPALDEWVVQDLNQNPQLPWPEASFDAVLIAVSVQYIQRPLEIFAEIARVLEPGGLCVISFSNRCFPTKAVALWQALGDHDHVQLVGTYFHHSGGFQPAQWYERKQPGADPLYIVQARAAAD